MSIHRTTRVHCPFIVCLLALLAGPAAAQVQVAASADAEIDIVEARLLAPDPATDGVWLAEVEEVLNGAVAGSVIAVAGLAPEMVALGSPAGRGERLRLVLTPGAGDRAAFRVLSAHASPAPDAALADPLPPPLLAPSGAVERPPEAAPIAPKAVPAATPEEQVVDLVNQQRWSYNNGHLPPLKQVAELDAAAELHSSNMAARNFFSHCDLDTLTSPWDRIVAAGYFWSNAAENLTAGWPTAAQAVNAWMNSAGHRANILSTGLAEIGVGYYYQSGDQADIRNNLNSDCTADTFNNGPYYHYWSQDFGARSTVFPVVIEREAHSTTSTSVALYVYGTGWASQMRFSNDGATWSAWQTFNPNKTWTLSGGGGPKTVYAQIKNSSGTVRQASDTIYLDAPCTASTTVNVANQTVTGTASWAACVTVNAVSGFTVGATGDVTFQAGQRVVLGDGFAVLPGGSFKAVIAPPP